MRLVLGLLLAEQLSWECSAWSPGLSFPWRSTARKHDVPQRQETRIRLPMASGDSDDSTMSAYEKAMAEIAAAGRPIQPEPTTFFTTTATTSPSAEESSATSAYETALRELQQDDQQAAHDYWNTDITNNNFDHDETTFLEDAFNDPGYIEQEMRDLEATASWTGTTNTATTTTTTQEEYQPPSYGWVPYQTPGTNSEDALFPQEVPQQPEEWPQQYEPFPTAPESDTTSTLASQTPPETAPEKTEEVPQPEWPRQYEPFPTTPEPVFDTTTTASQAPPETEPQKSAPQISAGFLEALSPNSERQGFLTAKQDAPSPATVEETDTTSSDTWVPPLMFVSKEDPTDTQDEEVAGSSILSLEPEPISPVAASAAGGVLPTAKQQLQQPDLVLESPPEPVASVDPYNLRLEEAVMPPVETAPPPTAEVIPATTDWQEEATSSVKEEAIVTPQPPAEESSHPFNLITKNPKLNNFMNTAWDEFGKGRRIKVDPVKAVADMTKDVLGIKRPETEKAVNPAFAVKPGVTKRIMDALDAKQQHGQTDNQPRPLSRWAAFQISEARWEDMKKSRKFKYDLKLYQHIQDGAVPPRQFVSEDCARGNAKGCAKLRDICESADECHSLDEEGPPLDDNGLPIMDFDVVVLGGTLGIFYARALQLKGLKVCVAAPRALQGQEQEWNVGLRDLKELTSLGVLTPEDIDAAVTTVFDGTRAGFKNREVTPLRGGFYENGGTGFECYLKGVLNLGLSPAILIDRVAKRFYEMGGVIRERCPLNGVAVSAQVGCAIDLGSYDKDEDVEPITAKMVLDCMGYGSPVARQQRYGVKPDSICMVFGSCAEGYNPDRNRFADAMYTFNQLQDFGNHGRHQYFWESFPVGTNLTMPFTSDKSLFDMLTFGNSGVNEKDGTQKKSSTKTTYMFTYLDAHKRRPALEELMDDYWKLLPTYQRSINDPETDLNIERVLYDYFPAYRDSPMKPHFNRVLSVGEASGSQGPISFGGFRSLSRNLGRISGAVAEAVEMGCLHKDDLGDINCYQPNLSAGWLMRDVMSVKMGKNVRPDFTNRVLSVYLKAMNDLGPSTITPLMHDVLRFDALSKSIVLGIFADPSLMGEMVKHVGVSKMMDFLGHLSNMGWYSLLDTSMSPIMELMLKQIKDPRTKFQWRRRMEAWKYGSGNDYQS
eukprot:Sro2822_g337970.2  (1168) ;mRNA; f:4275-7862